MLGIGSEWSLYQIYVLDCSSRELSFFTLSLPKPLVPLTSYALAIDAPASVFQHVFPGESRFLISVDLYINFFNFHDSVLTISNENNVTALYGSYMCFFILSAHSRSFASIQHL
jgi:hypothetical protein